MEFFKKIICYVVFWAIFALSFLLGSCETNQFEKIGRERKEMDSISIWLELGMDSKIEKEIRLDNLTKAYNTLLLSENDSLRINKLLDIIDQYYELGESALFKSANNKIYLISLKENDTESIAEYHWNKGNILSDSIVLDSAYYHYNKASLLYEKIGNQYYMAKMHFNMSHIQLQVKNYVESEILVIKAINTFKNLNKNLNLYLSYNRLLLLDKELGNYEKSLEHYDNAINYLNKIENQEDFNEKSLNNLSLIYQKQGKYDLAIATLNKALDDPELPATNYNLYTKLIDNRAYCRFLKGDTLQVLHDFKRALAMRQEMENEAGIAISKLHLSEYFLKAKDSAEATAAASEAYEISSRLHFNRDILVSLDLLADSDPKNASTYMHRYVTLNDSLLQEERKIRDKFTRIQFETEGYISANKELQQKNVWISLSSILALASLAFLFLNYRQRSRNRTLVLEKQQQNANEEIYNLMLKQQSKTEEGRIQERVRIAEELHDGVLAKLFSVRIGMGFLALKGEEKDELQYQAFMDELQTVEKEIRMLSHELKNDELSSKKDFPILLKELLEEQGKLGGFAHQLDQDPSIAWDRVSDKIKINLYRMAQEAIHNVMKYAACSEVKIHLEKNEDTFEMSIKDNGKGFDLNQKRKGIGLKNMKSRVKSIGAGLQIASNPGEGTTIKITIPTKILYHEPNE